MDFWKQVGAVLAEAKREQLDWDEAWFKAMRSIFPERKTRISSVVRDALAQDRDLLRELKPYFQAAYEDRAVTAEEFEAAAAKSEKRLDLLMAA